MLFTTASAGVLSKCPKQGLTLESTGSLARSHTQNCIVLGKDSHPSLHVLDKVSQPSPQWLGNDSHTHMYGPWARTHTRARSVLSTSSHSNAQGPGQGITPDPTGPRQGFTSEPRGHRQGLSQARMVLGKDSHPSPQRPRHGLKPEPLSPRQGFSVNPHGLRQGLTLEPPRS